MNNDVQPVYNDIELGINPEKNQLIEQFQGIDASNSNRSSRRSILIDKFSKEIRVQDNIIQKSVFQELAESQRQIGNLSSTVNKINLGMKDISMWVDLATKGPPCCKKTIGRKVILYKMSAQFPAGSMTGIIGPSGSGKTSLLSYLNQTLDRSILKVNGDIFVNGKKAKDLTKIQDKMAFVSQFDYINALSTPEENFKFVADLIYPKSHYTEANK